MEVLNIKWDKEKDEMIARLEQHIEELNRFLRFHWQNHDVTGCFCNFCNGIGPTYDTVDHFPDCIVFALPENRGRVK